MKYRKYNPKRDKKAVHNIWKEVGWLKDGNEKAMDVLIEKSRSIVADVNGKAECLVVSWPGNIMYLKEKISLSSIAAVTTSLIARKQKLAGRLTAERIALDAIAGTEMCGLSMFEQGYYEKLGFGVGNYIHYAAIAPSTLNVSITPRVPIRLEKKDWKKMHECRLKRMRLHGSCSSDIPAVTQGAILSAKAGMGFGYNNRKGELTHFVWMTGKGIESGPINVWYLVYQTYDQLIELLALLKSFGDQIQLINLDEPPNIQIQDFLTTPFKYRKITEMSKYENRMRAAAWYQWRILDLNKCLKKTHLPGEDVTFNLKLHDPIEKYLDKNAKWRGVAGDYIVTFGKKSSAKKGTDKSLPTLEAEVGAFTRMWLGCLSATSVAVSDNLTGPKQLLEDLDDALRLPAPKPDWPF